MSKNLEVLKADVKKLMLKDWTETEVTKLDEFMEDVIIATMLVNKLPIHIVVGQSEQFSCPLPDARCDRHKIDDEEGRWEFCNTCKREWARELPLTQRLATF